MPGVSIGNEIGNRTGGDVAAIILRNLRTIYHPQPE